MKFSDCILLYVTAIDGVVVWVAAAIHIEPTILPCVNADSNSTVRLRPLCRRTLDSDSCGVFCGIVFFWGTRLQPTSVAPSLSLSVYVKCEVSIQRYSANHLHLNAVGCHRQPVKLAVRALIS